MTHACVVPEEDLIHSHVCETAGGYTWQTVVCVFVLCVALGLREECEGHDTQFLCL